MSNAQRGLGLVILMLLQLVCVSSLSTPAASGLSESPLEISNALPTGTDEQALRTRATALMMSYFEQNLGQVANREVFYYGRIPGGMIGFGSSMVLIWLTNTSSSIVLRFTGDSLVHPRGVSALSHRSNFFLGDRGTFTDVISFDRISYDNVWPGISVQFTATDHGAKSQFIVSPGANPSLIEIRTEGHDGLRVSPHTLSIAQEGHAFLDDGLCAVQGSENVSVCFTSLGENAYGFRVGLFDPSRTLVIDPLLYATCLGGSAFSGAESVALDDSGCAYISGYTESLDFPTASPYNGTFGGGNADCFVVKLPSSGDHLDYSTFIGGAGYDAAHDLQVDWHGSIYVVGETSSADFPVTNTFDGLNGTVDCFALRLNSTGNGLDYSRFCGGTGQEAALSMFLSQTGFVYFTGWTNSSDFTVRNGIQETQGGGRDMILVVVAPSGVITYASFYGGTSDEVGEGVTVDSEGNIIFTGRVEEGWPTYSAMNSSLNGACDIGVCKLNPLGDTVLWSTYLGGSDADFVKDVLVDSSDNICMSGFTNSSDFLTLNACNESLNGGFDVFVLSIESDGASLSFSTYVGGSDDDYSYGLGIDRFNHLYIVGSTFSADFPILNAYNDTYGGNEECFLLKLSHLGDEVAFSTFFGGSGVDTACDIFVDEMGRTYIAGTSNSSDFLVVCQSPYRGWLEGWDNRKSHSISAGVGAGTDYQVQITVHYLSGTDSGDDVYCDSRCQADFDDIRFTDDDGGRLLSYWCEECVSSDYAVFWVRLLDDLDYNQSIYVYYGNPYATSESDGDATFRFFDDFSGTSLNTSKWGVESYGPDPCTYEVTGGSLHADIQSTTAGTSSGFTFTSIETFADTAFRIHVRSHWSGLDYSRGWGHVQAPLLRDSSSQSTGLSVNVYGDYYVCVYTFLDSSGSFTSVSSSSSGSEVFDYRVSQGTTFNMQMSGTYSRLYSGTVSGFTYPFRLGLWADLNDWTGNLYADVYYDRVYLSKYASVEPTHSSWGSEEDRLLVPGEAYVFAIAFPLFDDSDGDSISDADEALYGTDPFSNDTDSDQMPDGWEVLNGLNATDPSDATEDPDLDGLVNLQEHSSGSLPFNSDTDLDEIPDLWEVMNGTHVRHPDAAEDPDVDGLENIHEYGNGTFPFDDDTDGDSLLDGFEVIILGTSPLSNDTDSDFMPDAWEVLYSLDPLVDDSAGDPDTDMLTNLQEYQLGTSPRNDDTDSDQMPDFWEVDNDLDPLMDDSMEDPDSDGLVNLFEYGNSTLPRNNDTDLDLIPDGWEIDHALNATFDDAAEDPDMDGLVNLLEFQSLTDPHDNDTDSDLMPDGWEADNILDPLVDDAGGDADSDGMINLEEYLTGCNPNDPDSDDDQMPDGWESSNDLNPTEDDANLDPDSDGLTNLEEYQYDPLLEPQDNDTDSDAMPDGWEVHNGLDPLADDAGGDADSDGLTNLEEYQNGADPNQVDTEGDGMPDLWEVDHALDPTLDDSDEDADADGLPNLQEYEYGCDPRDADSDDDQLSDGQEINDYGTSPTTVDSDGDQLGDGEEAHTYGTNPILVDSDNDTLVDGVEVLIYGTDPTLYDTDGDGMDDGTEVRNGTDPLVADSALDSDGDGLSNIQEIEIGTDLHNSDTDHDGISDGAEVAQGLDPLRYNAPVDLAGIGILGLMAGSVAVAVIAFVSTEIKVLRLQRPMTLRTKAERLAEDEAKEGVE